MRVIGRWMDFWHWFGAACCFPWSSVKKNTWYVVNKLLFFVPQRQEQELFPLGHSCAVCGKVKCKRHRYVNAACERINMSTGSHPDNNSFIPVCRTTLLLENYQPWLDLKVHSKVDASLAEVQVRLKSLKNISHNEVMTVFLLSSDRPAGVRADPGELRVPLVQVWTPPWLIGENVVFVLWLEVSALCDPFRDITDDEACLDEVKMTFRFFTSVLIRRAQKVTLPRRAEEFLRLSRQLQILLLFVFPVKRR